VFTKYAKNSVEIIGLNLKAINYIIILNYSIIIWSGTVFKDDSLCVCIGNSLNNGLIDFIQHLWLKYTLINRDNVMYVYNILRLIR
jgi:hypothetical protein